MSHKIVALPFFNRRLKRLAKKFNSLRGELADLETAIENNPRLGTNLGGGLFKIRLASKSKGTGKSGGFRVVTYYVEQIGDEEVVYLVTIYDKSEDDSFDKEILLAIVQDALHDSDDSTEQNDF